MRTPITIAAIFIVVGISDAPAADAPAAEQCKKVVYPPKSLGASLYECENPGLSAAIEGCLPQIL